MSGVRHTNKIEMISHSSAAGDSPGLCSRSPPTPAIARHRRPKLRDEDYYDLFEESEPIDVSRWRTHSKDHPPRRQEHPADSIYPQMPEDDPGPSMDTTPSHYPQMPEDDS